jgi:tetraacyldisaccharide 4'-kinase
LFEPWGAVTPDLPGGRAVAVAGVARPDRFFTDLRAAGWTIVREVVFRDHHPFTPDDVALIVRLGRSERADLILTTEKDAVRLAPFRPIPARVAAVPLIISLEPADLQALLTRALAAHAAREA